MTRPYVLVETLNDPHVAPYRNLKERDLAALPGGLFIAEGEPVVRRLLASGVGVESVFIAERRVAEIAPLVPVDVPLLVAPSTVMNGVLGYKFHSGVMAAGRRPASLALEDLVRPLSRPLTLVVCPELANTANLGGLIRIAAAFGADAMVLGERSCDPFFRQSVRVSMGAVFRLPILRSDDLLSDVRRLGREWGVELIASVLDDSADALAGLTRTDRIAILFGNEAQGLPPEYQHACDRRITIPMKLGTDSLNVSVAAGVFLYHLTRA